MRKQQLRSLTEGGLCVFPVVRVPFQRPVVPRVADVSLLLRCRMWYTMVTAKAPR